jgi:CBS domain-containing protein
MGGMSRYSDDKFMNNHRLERTKSSELMITKLAKLEPDDRINVAIEVFCKNMFHALPVVENGELVGIVTPFDILKILQVEKPPHPEDVYEESK